MNNDQARPQPVNVPTDIGAGYAPPQAPVSVTGGTGSVPAVPLGFAPPNAPVQIPSQPGSHGQTRK